MEASHGYVEFLHVLSFRQTLPLRLLRHRRQEQTKRRAYGTGRGSATSQCHHSHLSRSPLLDGGFGPATLITFKRCAWQLPGPSAQLGIRGLVEMSGQFRTLLIALCYCACYVSSRIASACARKARLPDAGSRRSRRQILILHHRTAHH